MDSLISDATPTRTTAAGSAPVLVPPATLHAPAPTAPAPAGPAMPRETPLAMPIQSLRRFSKKERRAWADPRRSRIPWFDRFIVFGGAFALTALGAREMYGVVEVGKITPLEWALVVLFVVNFSWIAVAFTSSVLGFFWLIFRAPRHGTLPTQLSGKTAVVMPIYNEAPARVFSALQAIEEDVSATAVGDSFDYFFLSDTTDPDVWIAEERALLAMRQRRPNARIYYRRRKKNVSRKAGNIADFVMRWGAAYPQMVVLDADSLMTADAIIRLAATMESDPDAGIIQSLPLIVNRNTLFARVQQFAARIAGPILAAGLTAWMGRDGNYWGHNAIIRTRAFADHCGMPDLAGRPPFGGHILSHDFVEAALIRRAGWAVYMLPTLGGSFEESPPSLIDLAARDRRWCQGNLQHIRVLPSKGFVLATRQHFLTGIMGYLASPLWMAQLIIGIVLVLQSKYIRPEYFTADFSLFPTWPVFDYRRALRLFEITIAVLLAPKLLGMIAALFHGPTRRGCGGAIRLVISTLLEILISAAVAPIMMLIQTGSVVQIVSGRDTGWNPQRRDDGSIPFKSIVRRHRSHMAMGVIALIAAGVLSPSLVIWMSPTIAGLILSIPISWASGQLWIGAGLRRIGLLATPEETHTPPIIARANALAAELERTGHDGEDGLRAIVGDPKFREAHEMFLPEAGRRRRGEIDVDEAVATAKLTDARTLDEACAWLKPKERLAVLHDRALISLLARLPTTIEPAPARSRKAQPTQRSPSGRARRALAPRSNSGKAMNPATKPPTCATQATGASEAPSVRAPAPNMKLVAIQMPMKSSARRSVKTSRRLAARASASGRASEALKPRGPPSGAPGWKMKRAAAAIRPESAAEAPIIGSKSNGEMAQCASAPATEVNTKKARKRTGPKRRAIGGPNATSQMQLTPTCAQEPCRNA